uniref:hypothetical protein n=1 Tax=Gemmiger qucibialis TaxID=2997294 RepID=UPI0040266446
CRTSLAVSALRIMRYCPNIIHYRASATGQIILFCYTSVMIFANNIRMLIKMFFSAFLFYRGATTKKCPPAARQRAGAFMLIPLLLRRDYSMPVTV